jgi:hypothetical protein
VLEPVLWALLTGIVTGGVWLGIVLARRQRRLTQQDPVLLEDVRERLLRLEDVERRLAEVEERLDFTERLLARQREAERLTPPSG